MIASMVALCLVAFSPLEAEQGDVQKGNEKLLSGDASAALKSYEEAERRAGAHPEIDYDRGEAAYRLDELDLAERSFRRAAEKAARGLSSRALQNLGNTLEKKGDAKGALSAYADALQKDPKNEDARYDLEVLLRRTQPPPPPQKSGSDGKDAKNGEDGKGAQSKGGEKKDDPNRSGSKDTPPSVKPEPAQNEPAKNGADPRAGEDSSDKAQGDERAGRERGPLTRQDAEKLLDALRAREKNMPFFGREKKTTGRSDAERDW